MKHLGIDFGEKKIGLAISNSSGTIALPFKIIDNNGLDEVIEKINNIIEKEKISVIVIGKSLDFKGKENNINVLINNFVDNFKKKYPLFENKIYFENEIFTSISAKWGIEKPIRRMDIKNKKGNRKNKKEERIDHKAAMMILKSFLERQKNIL